MFTNSSSPECLKSLYDNAIHVLFPVACSLFPSSSAIASVTDSLRQSFELEPEFWRKLLELAFRIIPQILWAIGILLLTRLAISIVGRLTNKTLRNSQPTVRKFLTQAAEILTLSVGVIAFLNTLGIQATSIVAVIGAAGLAIGLALQNTLSHFAAGIMLISLRPFEVGDFIEAGGVAGEVDSIGIFSTTLVTPDNVRITVPNGSLFNSTLKNKTAMGTRRVDLEIDIGDRSINPTIDLLLSKVQTHPLVLKDPETTCDVASISATTTVLYLRPWCAAKDYEKVRSLVQQIVKETLQ